LIDEWIVDCAFRPSSTSWNMKRGLNVRAREITSISNRVNRCWADIRDPIDIEAGLVIVLVSFGRRKKEEGKEERTNVNLRSSIEHVIENVARSEIIRFR
jgi:hypothetical protein